MQRNLLSAKHFFLLGLASFTLSGCVETRNTPWSPSKNTSGGQQSGTIATDPNAPASENIQPIPKQSKIALLLPLSGKGAETGQAMLNAAQLAMFDMNATSLF